jgi:hypothetical protein
MREIHSHRIRAAIAVLALMALACGLDLGLGPTAPPPTVPPPPPQLPTAIPLPISSPISLPEPAAQDSAAPPAVPEATAAEAGGDVMAEVDNYYQKAYLPFENGELSVLDDVSMAGRSLNVFDFTRTRQQVQDFALWADIVLQTTGTTEYPDYTGCGFAYRVQNNNEGYTAILTNQAVRMGACSSGMKVCTLFGTTFGTGVTDVRNGQKAEFSLAVNKDRAWAFVDGVEVGQYSLYTTKLQGTGDLSYANVSYTNAGYRTSCEISNVRVWQSLP